MNLVYLDVFQLMTSRFPKNVTYEELEKYETEWLDYFDSIFKVNYNFSKNKSLKLIYISGIEKSNYDDYDFIFRNSNESFISNKCLLKVYMDFFPEFSGDITKKEALANFARKNVILFDMFYAAPYYWTYEANKIITEIPKNYYFYHDNANFQKAIRPLIAELGDEADVEIRFRF